VITTELTRVIARMLLAPVLVVAFAVLVKGYVDVGDGFAAGIIAALGVLLQYVVFGRDAVAAILPVHRASALAFAGLGVAVAVALVPLATGRTLLEHLPAPGSEVTTIGTVELITAVAFDVGVFLLVVGSAVAIIDAIAATPGPDA
jgi:multisubunit Na+/H+ antiporter MnhB subunit